MHPHLHTKDNRNCEAVMTALDECHARGFLYKASGMCNQAKREVTLCLRAERIERTRKNREAAREKRKSIEERWKQIEENP
ncbi:cytochrome c oxidase biogenesis protein Cmc1-like protein [Geopyxis carbonaria]|nr:cytochrome c oxidase biogenesis protein Cmc1-like protein [Geopyxis carbonaria]